MAMRLTGLLRNQDDTAQSQILGLFLVNLSIAARLAYAAPPQVKASTLEGMNELTQIVSKQIVALANPRFERLGYPAEAFRQLVEETTQRYQLASYVAWALDEVAGRLERLP